MSAEERSKKEVDKIPRLSYDVEQLRKENEKLRKDVEFLKKTVADLRYKINFPLSDE